MDQQHEISILVCYTSPDEPYLTPLIDEFELLSEVNDYVEVHQIDPANNYVALMRNQALLQDADILIILLSSSFLRSTFYRRLLRNNLELHRGKKVMPLLIHPCQWQYESFFIPFREELEESVLLQQIFAQNEYVEHLINQAGRVVGVAYAVSRLNYVQEQQALEQAARERRKSLIGKFWLVVKVSGGFLVMASAFILYQKIQSAKMDSSFPQQDSVYVERLIGDTMLYGVKEEQITEGEEITKKGVSAGDSTLYERAYPVGEGRLAALQKEPLGWRLLDTNWLPVNECLYRRMYHQPGFRRGRMVVKYGQDFFYIDPQGRHLPDEVSMD